MKERSGMSGKATALVVAGILAALGIAYLAIESGSYRKNEDRQAEEADKFYRKATERNDSLQLQIDREKVEADRKRAKADEMIRAKAALDERERIKERFREAAQEK